MSNVGIKRPCECTIAHDISLENVSRMHELSEAFHAISLRHTCLLSILEQFSKLSSRAGVEHLENIRIHYHQTLKRWRKNFLDNERVRSLQLELKSRIEEFEKLDKFHMEQMEEEVTVRNAHIHQQKVGSLECFMVAKSSVGEFSKTDIVEGMCISPLLHLI
eukprot:XP_019073643.1 PREDICTED: uncharacterized protein LOC104878154 isoform X2 [Vitis vinifera]